MKLLIAESRLTDPHHNLALEETLLNSAADAVILYLWQNENTVVIGRNQNPWKECRTSLLQEEGGRLARRLSGGGAVFHDLGNLNFTFLMPQERYDLDRQLEVICTAVRSFGIDAVRSGRNDILAGDRKFSGNAFYKNGHTAYHHGTVLIDADMEKLGRYLSPSKAKLSAKGVDSVRSRVGNLRELNPDISVEDMKAALWSAFAQVYNGSVEKFDIPCDEALLERYRSWEWNYGRKLPFTFAWEDRLDFGCIRLEAQVEQGRIQAAKVWTDAMDWQLAEKLETALTGSRLNRAELTEKAPEFSEVFQRMDL
ncbi:MAG: lipoate--protein ligase [Oscillospiraceae bacterium]|nr:lipoate--protein ligase [Oscillospiraceae bacterium]